MVREVVCSFLTTKASLLTAIAISAFLVEGTCANRLHASFIPLQCLFCVPAFLAEERIRDVLSRLPTAILKEKRVTVTARVCYRGATGAGGPQNQDVAIIRLSAPL